MKVLDKDGKLTQQNKDSYIRIRVTAEQKKKIEIAAARYGVTMTEYILTKVLG